MVRASWLSLVLAVGCVLPDVALDDRPCPCAAGWVCDEANDVCVRSSDAGRRDGGVDAGPSRDGAVLDGAVLDGAVLDGAVLDGAVLDGAVLDGAVLDGAVDAPMVVDDAGVDAGVDAGAPDAGPPVDIVFEEDFESGTTSAWSYTEETDGTVRVVTSAAMAHGGTRFLRATTTANGGKAAIGVDLGRAITSGDVWVRLHFYGAASANYVSGITVGAVGVASPPWESFSLQLAATQVSLWIETALLYQPGTEPPARDRWQCMVGHLRVSDVGGSMEMILDGRSAVSATNIDTRAHIGWSVLEVGISYSQPDQPGTEIFVDDVTVATTPLACD